MIKRLWNAFWLKYALPPLVCKCCDVPLTYDEQQAPLYMGKHLVCEDCRNPDAFISLDAIAFVSHVLGVIARNEICILYEVPFLNDRSRTLWPQMANPKFRTTVLEMLPTAEFNPPNDLDEWTFVMYPPRSEARV